MVSSKHTKPCENFKDIEMSDIPANHASGWPL